MGAGRLRCTPGKRDAREVPFGAVSLNPSGCNSERVFCTVAGSTGRAFSCALRLGRDGEYVIDDVVVLFDDVDLAEHEADRPAPVANRRVRWPSHT
jgi:hypothetical protein